MIDEKEEPVIEAHFRATLVLIDVYPSGEERVTMARRAWLRLREVERGIDAEARDEWLRERHQEVLDELRERF